MKNHCLSCFTALLIVGLSFMLCESAFSQTNTTEAAGNAEYVSGITTGRARALIGGVAGLICLITGWMAKSRSSTGANVRVSAMVAVFLGLIGIALSVVHLSTSAGAVFGSGSGKAGAIVGLVLSLVGMTFGWMALKKNNERSTNGN
jgi:hypothetical protein